MNEKTETPLTPDPKEAKGPSPPTNPKEQARLISEATLYFLQGIGIGKLYWTVDESRIRPITEIGDYVQRLKENIERGRGMILSGTIGSGKTSILSFIAQKAFQIGKFGGCALDTFTPQSWNALFDIRFCPVLKFFDLVFERDFQAIDRFRECDLLLLDDFGAEHPSDYPVSQFEGLIEYRYANMRSTCVTTNLSVMQLRDLDFYARVIDRWRDKKLFPYDLIEIGGNSQRETK